MKKSLIALAALSAFATAAQAQSSVTAYGIIDYGYKSQTTSARIDSTTVTDAWRTLNATGPASSNQNTSRLGFRGTEDLGGGLKANFVMEFGMDPANGNLVVSGSTARQTFVGLSHAKLGSISAGRMPTLTHGAVCANDAAGCNNIAGTFYNGSDFTAATTSGTQSTYARAYDVYQDNVVTYVAPTIAGLTLSVQAGRNNNTYSDATHGESASTTTTTELVMTPSRSLSASAKYTWGKLTVDASTAKNTTHTSGQASVTVERQVYGASYDFGFAKVSGFRFSSTTTDKANLVTATNAVNQLGVNVPVNAKIDAFAVAFRGNDDSGTTVATQFDVKGEQVGVNYKFSKRTNAYLISGRTSFDNLNNVDGLKRKATAIGVRHTF